MRLARSVFACLVFFGRICWAVAPSQVINFGSSAVSGTGTPLSITLPLTGASAIPSASMGSVDFTAGALACNAAVTSCSSTVTFSPKTPGLKQDALILTDAAGNLLASAFVNGIGVAPALQVLPATISTVAGSGSMGKLDGGALSANFWGPEGLAVDLHNNVYIADSLNQVVRKFSAATQLVSTVAGSGQAGYYGDRGSALLATLNNPTGVAVDAGGNLYIADQGNSLIRRVDAVSGVITTVAGGGGSSANGVAATTAALSGPNNIAVDTAGNLYISDSFHNLIRKVTASTGLIATIAGGGTAAGTDTIGDGALATAAQLNDPTGLALDSSGNLYFADTGHSMIRRVDVNSGIITAVAGTGAQGSAGDGALAINATLGLPTGVRLDAAHNLYIVDTGMHRVRFVNSTTGIISTLAGNGTPGYSGDSGNSAVASLNSPNDIVLGSSGNAVISDYSNNVLRAIVFRPPPLTFPSTNVTLTSGTVPLMLENYGNANLTLSTLGITGPFQQTASGGTDCSISTPLLSGAGCEIGIIFAPTAVGAATGTVTVNSNNANLSASQMTVALSGTGLAGHAVLSVSAVSMSFPLQNIGISSLAQAVIITNTGTALLKALDIQLTGNNVADFNLSTTCQSTLAAGSSCTITATFAPLLSGLRSAGINIYAAATNSPQMITLGGTGLGGAVPSLGATALQFGSTNVGASSTSQAAILTNTGVAALQISSIALSGSNSTDFYIASTTCGSSLAVSASCTVSLSFIPTGGGNRVAQLVFADSAGTSPQFVALGGTGVVPCPVSMSSSSQIYLSAGALDSVTVSDSSACLWTATSNVPWITFTGPTSGSASGTLSYSVSANTTAQPRVGTISVGTTTEIITQSGIGLRYVPVTPCRVADTRRAVGPLGGPSIPSLTSRDFPIAGTCGIPANAQAYSMNATVVPAGVLHYLTVYPTGQTQPFVSTLNSPTGIIKANAAIVPAGAQGAVSAFATDTTDLILDINGYFVPYTDPSALTFYPLSPCRVADTRNPTGLLGGPYLSGLQARTFPLLSGPCGIPVTARAYSLNFTVVPRAGKLNYLSVWPAGQPQPGISTLNDDQGAIIANAAIVPAGSGGGISVFATQDIDLIVDVDGYFAPPNGGSGLSLYNVAPCRAFDTRANGGAPMIGTVTVNAGSCPLPSSQVQAYVFNATVVPTSGFHYLTLWQNGAAQPGVSTLNGGGVVSNMAIVPTINGLVNAFATDSTALILDLSAYFGP